MYITAHAPRRFSQHATLSLIRAVDASKVDYCCSVLAGVSDHAPSGLTDVLCDNDSQIPFIPAYYFLGTEKLQLPKKDPTILA